jgi:hypothetical protein
MRSLALCGLLLACGGHASQRDGVESVGDAGQAGAAQSVERGGSQSSGAAGGAQEPPPPTVVSTSAGRAGDGGAGLGGADGEAAGAGEAPSLLEPGTRTCQDDRDCLGLDCIGKAGQVGSMCSLPCAEQYPCAMNERCLSGPGLAPSCVVRCDVGTECSYPFDCFDPNHDGGWVCVPAPWTVKW